MTTGACELSEIFQSCVFLCLLGNFATTTSWRRLPNVPPLAPGPPPTVISTESLTVSLPEETPVSASLAARSGHVTDFRPMAVEQV